MKDPNIAKTTLLAILLIFTFNLLKAQETNFSGSWSVNIEKSYTIGISMSSVVEVQIKQSPATFDITRISKDNKVQAPAYTEVLSFDGTFSKPVAIGQNQNKKSTIRWSPDHKVLIEQSKYVDDQGNQVQKNTSTITLTNAGKTLQVKSIIEDDNGVYKMIQVFDRKD